MKSLQKGAVVLAFATILLIPHAPAHADTATSTATSTTTTSDTTMMMAQIQSLLAQIQALQAQLAQVKTRVTTLLNTGLQQGMTSTDITKIQQILATDPTIYPEGKITGYFGHLTKNALERFQKRHGIGATGEIDEDTQFLLEGYLQEGFGSTTPPGLLRAPGIQKKVEVRLAQDCEKHGRGLGPLCKQLKAHENEARNTSTTEFNVRITATEASSSTATSTSVSFTVHGTAYTVSTTGTSITEVLSAVADKLGVTVSELDPQLVKKISNELADAVDAPRTMLESRTHSTDRQDERD